MNIDLPPDLDALLVRRPENIRYISGFTAPEDAWVLYRPGDAVLFTDARYEEQAPNESRIAVEIVNPREGYGFLEPYVANRHVGYEPRYLPCFDLESLKAQTTAVWETTDNLIERARAVKTPGEISLIRNAAELADRGFEWLLSRIRPGVQEREIALDLEFWLRREGADGPAFEFIVASGERGALPHGVASTKNLLEGELVTIDFGAVISGYHSDMTRTVALGKVAGEMRQVFEIVLHALEAALSETRPGVSAGELDAVARNVINEAGYGAYFMHSLGHGVGLAVHEAPLLNARSKEILAPGMVITLEPGIYLPGKGGVRIEELVAVTENGAELLTKSPRSWMEVR